MYELGQIAGLRITVKPSALLGTLLLWALLGAIARWLGLALPQALAAGLAATVLHWLSDLIHHLGHAWAARRTGYPMLGVCFWGVLGTSIYPRDEPPLPAAVHIRRALGGPLASLLLAGLAGLATLLIGPSGGVAWWVALFCLLENLCINSLQALLPLGFNDGATLLYWWRRR